MDIPWFAKNPDLSLLCFGFLVLEVKRLKPATIGDLTEIVDNFAVEIDEEAVN